MGHVSISSLTSSSQRCCCCCAVAAFSSPLSTGSTMRLNGCVSAMNEWILNSSSSSCHQHIAPPPSATVAQPKRMHPSHQHTSRTCAGDCANSIACSFLPSVSTCADRVTELLLVSAVDLHAADTRRQSLDGCAHGRRAHHSHPSSRYRHDDLIECIAVCCVCCAGRRRQHLAAAAPQQIVQQSTRPG